MKLIDKILTEWAYRVHDGMPDPTNPLHFIHLDAALSELKILNVDVNDFIRKHTKDISDEIEKTEKQLLQEDKENVKDK